MPARKAAGAKASAAKKDDLPVYTQEDLEALDGLEHSSDSTVVGTADTQAVERVPRRLTAAQAQLDPNTLAGSWALYSSPGEAATEQALVVAEVQPGIYLCEFYDLMSDEPREQRIIPVETFAKKDDDGGTWAFYDEHEEVRMAFKRLIV